MRQVEFIREQARSCRSLGSPFYAELLDGLAQDVAAGGVGARVLAGHEDDPGPSALALRLLGAVHRLVLSGRAPALAAHYPSVGGDGDATAAWTVLRQVLVEHGSEVMAGLSVPPQTNEVGRSAPLFGGLLRVLADLPARTDGADLPLRILELGASGGLNLLADRFSYRAADGGSWPSRRGGGRGSHHPHAVLLDPAWDRVPEGAPARVEVYERGGCDLNPFDAATDEGALALLSFVWPDQTARLARLRAALVLARDHPVLVERAGAGEFVDRLQLAPGTHTVVWHSVMWQYVPTPEQQHVLDRLAELGRGASTDTVLTHLAFEPRRLERDGPHRFIVTETSWPAGRERILGEAPPHGVPVTWWPA